jgi:protein-S-isoprenylcysteine O-methyltransferase Ste14
VNDLARSAVLGLPGLIAVMGVLLFAPTWTLAYWQAWLYLFVFAVSSTLITGYLWKRDPQLLKRRIEAGPGAEREKSQQAIQLLASAVFIGSTVLPSLDHRFFWSAMPLPVVVAGDVLTAFGFLIVLLVFKENTFAAARIEVVPGQGVVSTGP